MSHLWGIVSSLVSFPHPIDKRAIFGMSRVPGSLIEKRCFQGKGKTAEVVLGYRGRDTILRPFSNETKTIWAILEGAIYNSRELIRDLKDSGHFLKSNSDGEVIAHLYANYGEDCIPRLNGKFTLAIWDQKRESLFLASDRMGQIPMYYIKLGNQLIFASQLNAILQHPEIEPEVDLNLLTKYLAYGFVPTPNTLLKGIKKLPSGHWLKYQHNRVAFTKYWDVHFSNQSKVFPDKSKKEYSQRIYRLLHASIKKRLDNNGHWGVFLSGGLDSSSLVAILRELVPSSSVKTFTVGFEKRSFDETEPAREIATLFKTEHHEVLLTPQKLLELLPGIVAAMDEPFSDDDVIGSCLVAQTARRYVNVALAGDGADELFMGYPAFLAHRLADYYERLPWLIRHFFMEQIARRLPVSSEYCSFDSRVKQFLSGIGYPREMRDAVWWGVFSPRDQAQLLIQRKELNLNKDDIYSEVNRLLQGSDARNKIDRSLYVYIKLLSQRWRMKINTASRVTSLKIRTPFLDYELMDYVNAIPHRFKLKPKYLLKKSIQRQLPLQTIRRTKRPFFIPLTQWMREDLKDLILGTLTEERIKREGLFNYSYILDLISKHLRGEENNAKQIWNLLIFESWYQKIKTEAKEGK